jgi:hypothetical protein
MANDPPVECADQRRQLSVGIETGDIPLDAANGKRSGIEQFTREFH